jgi:hypothetical protein
MFDGISDGVSGEAPSQACGQRQPHMVQSLFPLMRVLGDAGRSLRAGACGSKDRIGRGAVELRGARGKSAPVVG